MINVDDGVECVSVDEKIECHKCKKQIDAKELKEIHIDSFKRPDFHTKSIFIHCMKCLDELN